MRLLLLLLLVINECLCTGVKRETTGEATLEEQVEECNTEGCVEAANYLKMHMDPSVNPCDDFYSFSCGGFVKNTAIPEGKEFMDQLSIISDRIKVNLPLLLSDENSSEPAAILYKSCLHADTSLEEDTIQLQELLNEVGDWPVLSGDQWDNSTFSWLRTLYTFSSLGLPTDFLFQLSYATYSERLCTRHLYLNRPNGLWPLSASLEHNKHAKLYHEYMLNVARMLGVDEGQERQLWDVVALEDEIQQLRAHSFGGGSSIITIKDLTEFVPSFPWLDYFNATFLGATTVNEYQRIHVPDGHYVRKVIELMDSTDARTVANFFVWKAIDFAVDYLSQGTRDLKQPFIDSLEESRRRDYYSYYYEQLDYEDESESKTREEDCSETVTKSLPRNMISMFLRQFLPEPTKETVEGMAKELWYQFYEVIMKTEWMEKETKEKAARKLEDTEIQIGYPNETNILGDNQLSLSSHYLFNMMAIKKHQAMEYFKKLHAPSPPSPDVSVDSITSTKAFYYAARNLVDIPAGIIQDPIFSMERPDVLNYGAMGYVISHEINHGFNEKASYFDSDGHYDPWWTINTTLAFQERTECVQKMYEDLIWKNFQVKVRSNPVLEEILADQAGVKTAYMVYQKNKRNKVGQILPDFPYSTNQLYWLSMANFHCAKYNISDQKRNLPYETHPPRNARVYMAVMNSEQFARDWNCPAESPMNPSTKCKVW